MQGTLMPSTQIFKQNFAIRPKLRNSVLHYCGYSLSSSHMSSSRAFVEILLNNIDHNLQSGLLATSLGDIKCRRNHDFTVRGNSFLSRNLEPLARDYSTLWREYSSIRKDYAEYTMLSAHNAVNSIVIKSGLLLRRTDSLSGVETKNLADEIMTRKNTFT